MDEAPRTRPRKRPAKNLLARLRGGARGNERGQAFIEFLLVMFLSIAFLRFVFFNKEYGFKASLDKTMLRLGSHLEANLKTGAKPGADGVKSLEPFAGTARWSN